MKHVALALFYFLCVAGCGAPTSTGRSTAPPTTSTDRDNSGVNARDRDTSTKTPLDQNENKTDIDMTARIRKLVVNSKMSTNAHNVKIITQNGQVTLRGPVKYAEEKTKIEEFAEAVAGKGNVDNQLEVEVSP